MYLTFHFLYRIGYKKKQVEAEKDVWATSCLFTALKIRGNYIFSHQLLDIVNMLPRIDTSTKREHGTTIFIPFSVLLK
jgi:hypothetical protein